MYLNNLVHQHLADAVPILADVPYGILNIQFQPGASRLDPICRCVAKMHDA
ncbi:hypothetical protein A2U01_0099232, partial [Trifolium medium]|nr:hypothetical protein [Trifolium medium]